jgi:ornithine carbamoyltransferase
MARLIKFDDCKKLAENSSVPVIDALSDLNHPCQILGDLLTIREKFGKLTGLNLTYIGDCKNNVTYSLMHGCAQVGINVHLCCPNINEFKPDDKILVEAKQIATKNNCDLKIIHEPITALTNADIVYTDSWMSYHIPKELMELRKEKLMPYQVNAQLMAYASQKAVFMNCLPAMRGMEQTSEVIDSQQSIVFDQAENRLHIQKAIILKLIKIE